MEISPAVSFWVGVIGTVVGIVGCGIAIYQWAIINENKKRRQENQFLLAGIGHLALSKMQAWNNQIRLLPRPNSDEELEIFRIHTSARDDLGEVYSLASALEGTIDSRTSATTALLEKGMRQAELNNKLQEIGLQNPTRPKNPPDEDGSTNK